MYIQQLIIDQLVANLQCFYYFFSLILTNCAWFRTIFLDVDLGFFFFASPESSQLQNQSSLRIFPKFANLVFPLLMHNDTKSIPDSQRDTVINMSLYPWLQTLLSHSVHTFLYWFCAWPYTVHVLSYCRVWLLKCCKNKNSYDIKIYFLPIKIVLYLIKYIFITSPSFS